MFFEAILLKTVGFGALQNRLLSKAEGFQNFREILGLLTEISVKSLEFLEFLFFENHGFCFWRYSVFEIRKILGSEEHALNL